MDGCVAPDGRSELAGAMALVERMLAGPAARKAHGGAAVAEALSSDGVHHRADAGRLEDSKYYSCKVGTPAAECAAGVPCTILFDDHFRPPDFEVHW